MARREERKAELIAALAQSRARMNRSSGHVKEGLDLPNRVRHAISKHLPWWIGGAVLLGVVVTKLPRRSRAVVAPRNQKSVDTASVAKGGMALAAVKLAFDMTRPILMRIAMQRLRPMVEQWLAGRQGRGPQRPA